LRILNIVEVFVVLNIFVVFVVFIVSTIVDVPVPNIIHIIRVEIRPAHNGPGNGSENFSIGEMMVMMVVVVMEVVFIKLRLFNVVVEGVIVLLFGVRCALPFGVTVIIHQIIFFNSDVDPVFLLFHVIGVHLLIVVIAVFVINVVIIHVIVIVFIDNNFKDGVTMEALNRSHITEFFIFVADIILIMAIHPIVFIIHLVAVIVFVIIPIVVFICPQVSTDF